MVHDALLYFILEPQFCPTASLHITGASFALSGTCSFGKNSKHSRNIWLERNSRSSHWKGKKETQQNKTGNKIPGLKKAPWTLTLH